MALQERVSAITFIVTLIVVIFGVDLLRQWWRQNEWRRRWRNRDDDDR